MKWVLVPGTNLSVSRLGFGTSRLHHEFSRARRLALLDAAWNFGITHFDTSPLYGYGLAEKDLGVFLRSRRSEATVATKVGLYPPAMTLPSAAFVWARKGLGRIFPASSRPMADWAIARAERSLSLSLRRLRTERVDFLFLHEPDWALVHTDEFERWIEAQWARGTVGAWGVAGEAALIIPWVAARSRLAQVVQTRDSVDRQEANFLARSGRELQFTYGYLTSAARIGPGLPVEATIGAALVRNSKGSILVSTRHRERIAQLARAVA